MLDAQLSTSRTRVRISDMGANPSVRHANFKKIGYGDTVLNLDVGTGIQSLDIKNKLFYKLKLKRHKL